MGFFAQHKETKFQVGDTVKVNYRVIEKEKKAGTTKREVKEEIKQRIQPFEGIVIRIKGGKDTKSFTVRKIAGRAIGVERIFPLASPWITSIKVVKKGKVRRAKLNYLRKLTGKAAAYIKERK